MVVLGFLLSLLSYFLTYLALPDEANLGETSQQALIQPNKIIIVFAAFLLGFSDACFITQVASSGSPQ